MHCKPIYFVGPRYRHHASHSGYEGFARYLAVEWLSPVAMRRTGGRFGRRIDDAVVRLTSRPAYSLPAFVTEAAVALHMLRRRDALYHVIYGETDLWMLGRASRLTGNHLVATFHTPPLKQKTWAATARFLEGLAAAILVSDSQRAYYEQFLPPERIFVIPHGVDTGFFQPAHVVPDGPTLITSGRHLRDFLTLRRALKRIRSAVPNACLMAVGVGTQRKARFDGGVRLLSGIGDKELRRAYQRARVAVFSFGKATASNGILEAMACGLPIVATDVGGVREYVGDDAAVLCPPRDPDALATAVLGLLADPARAAAMGAAGRARALRFDFRQVADQHRAVYEQVRAIGRE